MHKVDVRPFMIIRVMSILMIVPVFAMLRELINYDINILLLIIGT